MRITPVLALLLALPVVPGAYADTFSGSGGGFSGSGTLTTTSNGDGSYTITGISGSGFGTLFTPGGYQHNDNQLFPGATNLVDSNGFAFTYTQGDTNYDVDVLSSGSGTYAADFTDLDSNMLSSMSVTFALNGTSPMATPHSFNFAFGATPAVTPEPSTLLLLGTGAVGILGIMRRRLGTR